jgi:hypothetical protein
MQGDVEEVTMKASVGDRIIVLATHLDAPDRDGEVIGVQGADGAPPYLVRWSADGHEALFYPGPDAVVHHRDPSIVD